MAAWFVVSVAVLLILPPLSSSQFPQGSGLYNQALQSGDAELDFVLENAPDLEDTFFPLKYSIPINYYVNVSTKDYVMNVIFDPCR